MINLSFNRHDFLYAVEGFARGSHLRQHVWQEIVYKSIPQMSDDDMDFLWFYMRRDIFERYFYELNGKKNTHFGYEDFMHALAALHRGNRYKVTFHSEIEHKQLQALCYRFKGEYHPLYLYIDGKVCWVSKIYFYDLSTTYLQFMVNYTKKDGTRSNREQYAWGVTKVE